MSIGIQITMGHPVCPMPPDTVEGALLHLKNLLIFEHLSPRLFNFVDSNIRMINDRYGSNIALVGFDGGNIVLTSNGQEIILPEALKRMVLIEKFKRWTSKK